MIPTQAFLDRIGVAIGADTACFADPTTFLKVTLVKTAFTPGTELVLGDVTVADFDGSTALHAADATPAVFRDPQNGDQIVQASDPAGGWHWQTTGSTNLPQTIYGYIVTDHTGANLQGSVLFDTPLVLNGVGQGVDVPAVQVRITALAIE